MNSAVASRNLLVPASTRRHPCADTADWTETWVCVGLAEQLTEVGAVLPATIGYHATHVRLTEDGPVAAFNARPFGGCASVPVHCASTRNVRCPHLACAFSQDGGVLDSASDPSGTARFEFVGDGRRTVTLPLARWGPLLFVNVTMTEPAPPPAADVPLPDQIVATGARLVPGNWLATPARTASAVDTALGGNGDTAVAPNLAVAHTDSETLVVFSRQAGHTRSTLVWALLTAPGANPRIDPQPLVDEVWGISRTP